METSAPRGAWEFEGSWREFLPIAITNVLLTLVTLGIYRFWAKARERRYLWSRTRFIDDHLEWTGTGTEMFIGFLLVMALFVPLLLILQFGVQALVLRGQPVAAGLLLLATYLGLLFLFGLAVFRALRYRLSRTWWRGIRGGSDDPGIHYAWSSLGRTLLVFITLGLLFPWQQSRLWNERWNKMSFGPHPFEAHLGSSGLFARWLLIYLAFFIGGVLAVLFGAAVISVGASPVGAVVAGLVLYALIGLATLAYYAAFFRKAVGATSWGDVRFGFDAHTSEWLALFIGNIALVVFTLGLGIAFLGYRNWSFAIRHMQASGTVNPALLTQSRTTAAGDAEGLAAAFDIGAI